MHPKSYVGRKLALIETVTVSRLNAEAPAFFVFDRSFGGGMDCLIDRSRVDLQAVDRDRVAADVERVERVAELVLRNRHRHKDRIPRLHDHQRIRASFHDSHRDRLLDDDRIHPHKGNRVGPTTSRSTTAGPVQCRISSAAPTAPNKIQVTRFI